VPQPNIEFASYFDHCFADKEVTLHMYDIWIEFFNHITQGSLIKTGGEKENHDSRSAELTEHQICPRYCAHNMFDDSIATELQPALRAHAS